MAKKKTQQTQGDTDMPAAEAAPQATDRSGSRHKPRKMLALSAHVYGLLKQLARRNKRPVTWEGRIAVCKALSEAGLISPEEAERMMQDDADEE